MSASQISLSELKTGRCIGTIVTRLLRFWEARMLRRMVFSQFLFSMHMKKGDTIFVGQYLFTGTETTSVWLETR
ncbi:hypothetical protein IGI04_031741 [Brassica rapa subsp. trilocularis]|uniref:Uncharacterized protein n=1 Tax=Brassica rapa subsp. trilocularis TaxID=1813537 RepID=A0ABQ7LVY7_BRACM|nr:hypothetical protein IGI04_031741 [Brassica rapa subsp. trilocularis]